MGFFQFLNLAARQREQAADMDSPFMIKYYDGFWMHDLGNTSNNLSLDTFRELASGAENNGKLNAGIWCIVQRDDT